MTGWILAAFVVCWLCALALLVAALRNAADARSFCALMTIAQNERDEARMECIEWRQTAWRKTALYEEASAHLESVSDEVATVRRAELLALAQVKDRDEEISRLRQQLSEVIYEVKPTIAVDVATEPPQIVRYEVKTPRTPRNKAGRVAQTGSDGEK